MSLVFLVLQIIFILIYDRIDKYCAKRKYDKYKNELSKQRK